MRRVLFGFVFLVACKDMAAEPPPAPAPVAVIAKQPAAGDLVQPGSVRAKTSEVKLVVLVPTGGDLAALEKLALDRGIAKSEVSRMSKAELGIDADYLALFDLSPADRAEVEAAEALSFRVEGPDGFASLMRIAKSAVAVASASKGWILDTGIAALERPEVYRERITARPDVRKLIVVHSVMNESEPPHLDTMGMRRLGLPELYVSAAARSELTNVVTMVNATAQALLVNGDVPRAGEIVIDASKLGPGWNADDIRKDGGSGRASWRAKWIAHVVHEDGALMIELTPSTGDGPEGLARMSDDYFGASPDKVHEAAANDPELAAAGVQARRELAGLKTHFAKGVPPKERLAIKAAFTATDDYVEWMWVEVYSWRGNTLVGTLDNDPEHPMKIRRGSKVSIALEDVADFTHRLPDGTVNGGYSVEVFRKRGLDY